ncbi:MAG: ABC transporter permease subunit, partial [Chlamydiia bacterium]|nr:ABC transporter permease subunit [Chlamydiia bacterium]
YAQLNEVLRYRQRKMQDEVLASNAQSRGTPNEALPTLWRRDEEHIKAERVKQQRLRDALSDKYPQAEKEYARLLQEYAAAASPAPELRRDLAEARGIVVAYREADARIKYLEDRQKWLRDGNAAIGIDIMPLVRPFHWEDDAGGEQSLNQFVSWWHLTRINRKDLVAGLIFGVRISTVVGLTAVGLALLIGIPVGALAGYYGGKWDIAVFRLIEIWESMPAIFMLLLVVAVTQSKSIFLVIAVLGLFSWTGFSRYVRGEFLKQRNLPYVDACRAMGFGDARIVFGHVLPNAIPPLLTLLPFAILGAITSEAGLSFLGLGEEGSCSWGVLMDEGRTAFPGESYLLWPPAMMLTVLLVAIALVGDALRDALDPKMRH